MIKRAVIVTDYLNREELCKVDNCLLIGVDQGLQLLLEAGFTPDIAIGDFDSIDMKSFNAVPSTTQIIRYDADKSKSDTELAIDYCYENNIQELVIYNSLGGRFDHAFGVIQNLLYAESLGLEVEVRSIDTIMTLVTNELRVSGKGNTISLFSYGEESATISLKGFKYALENQSLAPNSCHGLSNIIVEDEGIISVISGTLLCIQVL